MRSSQQTGNTNKKSRSWSFVFCGIVVLITISKPRTTWWHNDYKYLVDKSRRQLRTREESLLAFCRIYYRAERIYSYRLVLGRLAIAWGRL